MKGTCCEGERSECEGLGGTFLGSLDTCEPNDCMEGLDFLAGRGHGYPSPNRLRGFMNDGSLRIELDAYSAGHWGVEVAVANPLDSVPHQILTGPGPTFGPDVRGWSFAGGRTSPITGLRIYAFSTAGYGAEVAGSRVAETVAVDCARGPGPTSSFQSTVRGFGWSGSAVVPLAGCEVTPYGSTYGARIAVGDMNGSRVSDVLAAPGPDPAALAYVSGFHYLPLDDRMAPIYLNQSVFPSATYGATLAAGALGY